MESEKATSGLNRVFADLWEDVAWLHLKWDLIRQVYGDRENLRILNSTAPQFFAICENALIDDILLGICRGTERAETFGKGNLTLARLRSQLDDEQFGEVGREMDRLISAALAATEFARKHRDRRIAHTDLETRAGGHGAKLPKLNFTLIQAALDSISNVMNVFERHFRSSDNGYSAPVHDNDGMKLIVYLKAEWTSSRETASGDAAELAVAAEPAQQTFVVQPVGSRRPAEPGRSTACAGRICYNGGR